MDKIKINNNRFIMLSEEEFNRLEAQTIGRADIARFWGISLSTLSEQPWKLPNFGRDSHGKPVKGRRNYRYLAKDFIDWVSTPVEELKRRYDSGNY